MFVLCIVSKDKRQVQDNENKETSRTKYKRSKKIPVKARFSAPVETDVGAHPATLEWVLGLFPGGKAART
jgi:hypothetical protein